MTSAQTVLGSVVSLWRYPVKSMMGEELNSAEVSHGGLFADRAYALRDTSDGKVASAKNPRKWPQLFDFRAAVSEAPRPGTDVPKLRITLPDGTIVTSDQPDINQILSNVLKRNVTLDSVAPRPEDALASRSAGPQTASAEEYWPDIPGLDHRDTVTDFGLPQGTFFDAAVVHLLTTATLDRLHALYPEGRFEARRFRPNMVIQTSDAQTSDAQNDFVENAWLGQRLAIGDAVRLSVTALCPRCVMVTLAQGDLPKDTGILRTPVQHNRANVGVYASVLQGGKIRRGDSVRLD